MSRQYRVCPVRGSKAEELRVYYEILSGILKKLREQGRSGGFATRGEGFFFKGECIEMLVSIVDGNGK